MRVGLRQRAPTRDPGRQACPESDGRRDEPGACERRCQGPRAMPPHARYGNRSAADCYRPSHASVEVPNARTMAERRVGRRHPFEKTAARYREPDQSAKYGVTHQPGLMRHQNHHQARLDERKTHFRAQGAEIIPERHAWSARRDIHNHRNQGGKMIVNRMKPVQTAAS